MTPQATIFFAGFGGGCAWFLCVFFYAVVLRPFIRKAHGQCRECGAELDAAGEPKRGQ
jgi:hypothetical protein